MLSTQLRQRATNYVAAREAQEQDPTGDEANLHLSEAYDQFVAQLEADSIPYFDDADVARIATAIVDRSFDVRYHKCGRGLVLDGQTFRIQGGKLAGHEIEDCPECGMRLNPFDLYADSGGGVRNLLREFGLYPTASSLILMEDPAKHATTLQELRDSVGNLGDGDLLAIYAVVVALMEDASTH
jgi:hypothetical protein